MVCVAIAQMDHQHNWLETGQNPVEFEFTALEFTSSTGININISDDRKSIYCR